ncbi:MAG: site-specific DNA-methyltransferase, partial [Ignavibacteriae bacterium]|nr:site-specific DNA-methyltransferase [Ignavibacteriota bacterium]
GLKKELIKYYNSFYGKREIKWKKQLGDDIDWRLSFDYLKEADTTKHVHRLHPYKGKFIPQLVEYFLDGHTDEFKQKVYFKSGDIVLDPFCGSGTALVQANELGMHAVGIDISAFNALISNVKVGKYDFVDLHKEINHITTELKKFISDSDTVKFENELLEELKKYNDEYFPSPEYKRRVRLNELDEEAYGSKKEQEFLPKYQELVKKYNIELNQMHADRFLDKWYLHHVRKEIEFVFQLVKSIKNVTTKKAVTIIFSRTIRSCRATTHADLATLIDPVATTYYCSKHGKICKPLFSILSWWERYSKDTISRLAKFEKLKTNTFQYCLTGDSRTIDIVHTLQKHHSNLAKLVKERKIRGIFSSPPYVGLIDYHEQHAYAYDLFGFKRNDEMEIGPLYKGGGKEAKGSYVEGIVAVLDNCKRFMIDDFDILLVANDKHNLYPLIAEKAGLCIVQQFKRPVLNRTEKDKGAYSESIFHMKGVKR